MGDVKCAFTFGLEHQALPFRAGQDSARDENGESQKRGEDTRASWQWRVETRDATGNQEAASKQEEGAAPGSVLLPLKRDGKGDRINDGQIRTENQGGINQEAARSFLLAREEDQQRQGEKDQSVAAEISRKRIREPGQIDQVFCPAQPGRAAGDRRSKDPIA